MAALIDFESARKKQKIKEERRKEREKILEQAEAEYERKERRKKKEELAGAGTWLLSSVSDRIDGEQKEIEDVLSRKSGDKKKKKKEKGKKKKKKHRRDSEAELGSSDEEDEMVWAEKSSTSETSRDKMATEARTPIGPKLERDSWMTAEADFVPTMTREDLRRRLMGKTEQQEQEEKAARQALEQPGMHARELNPYWKDGGTGLPSTKLSAQSRSAPVVGDGGLMYWRKALQRCKDIALEEGKTAEEVAVERFGSLEQIKSKIADAERLLDQDRGSRRANVSRCSDNSWRLDRNQESDARNHRDDWERKGRDTGDRDRGRDIYGDRDIRKTNKYDESDLRRGKDADRRDIGRDSDSAHIRRQANRSDSERRRSPDSKKRDFMRPNDDSDNESSSNKFEMLHVGEDRHNSETVKRTFIRPTDDSNNESSSRQTDAEKIGSSSKQRGFMHPSHDVNEKSSSSRQASSCDGNSDSSKLTFMRPIDDNSLSSRQKSSPSEGRSRESSKRTFMRPSDDVDERYRSPVKSKDVRDRDKEGVRWRKDDQSSSGSGLPAWKKSSTQRSAFTESDRSKDSQRRSGSSREYSSSSRSRSRSDDSSSYSYSNKSSHSSSDEEKQSKPGHDKVGHSSKESVQANKKVDKEENDVKKGTASEDDDEPVLLSRTDARGMTRPILMDEADTHQHRGKRRRKKDKISTHTGDKGERERYFADDDNYDLKTLVEREKLSTAEDQNQMFARLAGRGIGKTDDDFAVDDAFVDRAAQKQSDGFVASKERQLAIIEHKRMAASIERCPHCFNNVPKHLIVAIGIKVYLCVPAHRSMCEGHCLIVPMQHVTQGTVCDEDVWEEIKIFRKGLTRMFLDRDEDCVFMETCVSLKKCRHLVIECIAMDKEIGDMAPIYFKKAISECEKEWADNKKLIDLKGRDVRRAVPKGFPYFSVDFGMEGGFAHVIEDEHTFPHYFGREVVGGMMDVESTLWRKPHKENFEHQRRKVLTFSNMWKNYDWTHKLGGGRSQASDSTNKGGENESRQSQPSSSANESRENDSGISQASGSTNERKRKVDMTVTGSSESANESAAAKLKAALFG